jgi:hypothetical protein
MGNGRLFRQDKNGRGAKLTTPSSADIKNNWRYTSTLKIRMDRDNFMYVSPY